MTPTTHPPRPLSEAGVGDGVLMCRTFTKDEHVRTHYYNLVVNTAGPRLLRVGSMWFYRHSGKPRYRKQRGWLVEPTEENLAAWAECQERLRRENEERDRRVESQAAECRQKAEAAAGWLRGQTVGVIVTQVGVGPLVDIYEHMEKEGHVLIQPLTRAEKAHYREKARRMYERPRDDLNQPAVTIGDIADVSKGTNPGAWVQAWVWVPDEEVQHEHGKTDEGPGGQGADRGADRPAG